LPQALLLVEAQAASEFELEIGEQSASMRNGKLRAVVSRSRRVQFLHAISGKTLFEEPPIQYFAPPNRHFKYRDGRLYQIEAWFKSRDSEKFYGLGQHQHGRLDNKGSVIELQQRNTEVSIPFMVSNQGYGFLWNNPGLGRVELGMNATHWVNA
jgi:alpha-D-xyloside xylohydrolase